MQGYVAKYHFALWTSGITSNIKREVSFLPESMMVASNVAHLVSHVSLRLWNLRAPPTLKSSVYWKWMGL